MSLIQSGFLIGCLAVAIPLIVHLLSRWQVRQLELGTMRFFDEVVRDAARRRKIRRWLLLITRMALVALLALLFARPFLPSWTRRDGDRMRVILIDRSASMAMPGSGGRLIDDAVAAATDAARELGPDAQIQWAWFDSAVDPMPAQTTRPAPPRSLVGDTRFAPALAWARDRVAAAAESVADVVLVTDLQAGGLAGGLAGGGIDPAGPADSLRFPADVPVRLIDVGRPAANNLAIQHLAIPGPRIDARDAATVTATLFNFAAQPREDMPLTATARSVGSGGGIGGGGGGSVRLRKTVNVDAEQAAEVLFDFGPLKPGLWQITVAADVGDDQALDNERRTAIGVAQPTPVLVLDSGNRAGGGGGGGGAESFHLVTALRQDHRGIGFQPVDQPTDRLEAYPTADDRLEAYPTDDDRLEAYPTDPGRFDAKVVDLSDGGVGTLNPADTPLVVVANAATVPATLIDRLADYVQRGGRLLVFAGDRVGNDAATPNRWRQSKLAPGQFAAPLAGGVVPFRITRVADRGEMLRPFLDPQHGDLGRLAFDKIQPVDVRQDPNNESPVAVLAWFDGDRPAVTDQSLGDGRVVWFLASADESWGRWTTSPLYLPLVQQMAADVLGQTGEGPLRFRVIGESDGFERPGFEIRDAVQYVVNAPAGESDPARTTPDQLSDVFGLTLAGAADAPAGRSAATVSRRELWPFLAAAAFVLMLAEFCLANRTTA